MPHESDDELWQDLGLLHGDEWTRDFTLGSVSKLANGKTEYKLNASYISDYYTTWPKASASERRLYNMQSFTDADGLRVHTKLYYWNKWQSLLLQESQSFYGIEDFVRAFSKKMANLNILLWLYEIKVSVYRELSGRGYEKPLAQQPRSRVLFQADKWDSIPLRSGNIDSGLSRIQECCGPSSVTFNRPISHYWILDLTVFHACGRVL
jgi:hypothetical protein